MTSVRSRIYLASRSLRRRELLKQIGVAFELLLMRENPRRGADVDEAPLAGETPVAYVKRIAQAKAETGRRQVVMRNLPASPVLAADTIVVLDGEVIGKPDNAQHAQQLLRRLSGETHQVLTAVAVARKDHIETALSTSAVEFRELGDDEIRRYVASGEPLDKAGAYAIQGRAAVFVRAISGSYSGIMGLPLYETAELLRRIDITPI
ncbi:MAG: septum formation inhibitor Maf [Betaproteobacteria bacterium]|nr:septum formation inhibitor Maf [Betaproteobacteria bacterium]